MATEITSAVAAELEAAAKAAVDDAFADALGSDAVVQIRTGSPAGPGESAGGTLLASVTIASWTAGSPAAGQVTGSNPGAVTITASGEAGHFRINDSEGTAIIEGTVGELSADLILDDVNLVASGSLDLGAPVFTVPVTAATS